MGSTSESTEDEAGIVARRYSNPDRETLTDRGLYHSIEIPGGGILRGVMDMEFQRQRWNSFQLPEDLTGRTVLDIGPWDGFFTFEAEKRGAAVTAIDYADLDSFRQLHAILGSRALYRNMDVSELCPERTGIFDIVLCLGVLYHLKHPLRDLEKICSVTKDLCIIDTFVTDGAAVRAGEKAYMPTLEFYERDELGGQLDNWCGPSVSAVVALARAAGFAWVSVLDVAETTARFACHRQWPAAELSRLSSTPARTLNLHCHRHRGRSFRSDREEYVVIWLEVSDGTPPPDLTTVFPEVDGFGVAPLSCVVEGDRSQVSFRVPPGLTPGRHEACVSTRWAGRSDRLYFYLDLPPVQGLLELTAIQDGCSWIRGEVEWSNGGWVTLWVDGLTSEADAGNTLVMVAGVPHFPEFVDWVSGQINVRLRPVVAAGVHDVVVEHRGMISRPLTVAVLGWAPALHGIPAAVGVCGEG